MVHRNCCDNPYDNYVILSHGNGDFTRYGHLDSIAKGLVVGSTIDVNPPTLLGTMGNTSNGSSFGVHLHFGLYRDNGNGLWDGETVDKPVDPFGWAGQYPDPWVKDKGGPVSYYLWVYP